VAKPRKSEVASEPRLVECSFLIPVRQDAEISSGEEHPMAVWLWLNEELYRRFDGRTLAPGLYEGLWKSSSTGLPIHDETRRYLVAILESALGEIEMLLEEACLEFHQQCIYLSIGGYVRFIRPKP
jgi:hypothetical protein